MIFRPENLFVDITGTEKEYENVPKESLEFSKSLFTESCEKGHLEITTKKKNEAFVTAGQVQYVCRAGNFTNKGLKYNGALRVLRNQVGSTLSAVSERKEYKKPGVRRREEKKKNTINSRRNSKNNSRMNSRMSSKKYS